MAVRAFDGVDDRIAVGGGLIGAVCNSAYSIVVVAKPDLVGGGLNNNRCFASLQVGTSNALGSLNTFNDGSPGGLRVFTDTEFADVSVMGLDTSWQIVGYSKPAGTQAPRFHRKALGSGAWSHTDSGNTIANNASVVTTVEFGKLKNLDVEALAGRMAVVSVFPTALSDADVESIQTTPSTAKLLALGATGLWDLNQASVATDVLDLTGGGANQTAITGTSVINGDDPTGWTFGVVSSTETMVVRHAVGAGLW